MLRILNKHINPKPLYMQDVGIRFANNLVQEVLSMASLARRLD